MRRPEETRGDGGTWGRWASSLRSSRANSRRPDCFTDAVESGRRTTLSVRLRIAPVSTRKPSVQSGEKDATIVVQKGAGRKICFKCEMLHIRSAAPVVLSLSWMEATMPSSNRRRVIGALALGMAALAPALALGMAAALLSVSVRQKPVNAPQLSSAGLLQDADFRLSDHIGS